MRQSIKFIVRRDSLDEETYAIITACIDSGLDTDRSFLEALKSALSEWAKETKEGMDAWKGSSRDFNVGDLIDYCDAKSLRPFLTSRGIYNLKVETNCEDAPSRVWAYDSILMDVDDEQ
jgi:hypothetical protein